MSAVDWVPRYLACCPGELPRAIRDRGALRLAASVGMPPRLSIGSPIFAAPTDHVPLRLVLVDGEYLARGFLPRSGWTVIDCGANIGAFTAWAAHRMHVGRILAIEAVPSTYSALIANVGPGGTCRPPDGPEIATVSVAVSGERGTTSMSVADEQSSLSGHGRAAEFEGRPLAWREVEVATDTLDSIAFSHGFGDRIDLLKVDVEGMEAAAMLGGQRVLCAAQRVVFEYHGRNRLGECARLLGAYGLRERRRVPARHESRNGVSFWSR